MGKDASLCGVQVLKVKHCLRYDRGGGRSGKTIACSFPVWTSVDQSSAWGGPFTKHSCLKNGIAFKWPPDPEKNISAHNWLGLVIYGNVFSFKHGKEIFLRWPFYSLKNASSPASRQKCKLWLEKFSNLLAAVYILLFVHPLPSQSIFIAPSCIWVINFLSDLPHDI